VSGVSGTYEWNNRETDDFAQAGDLYRLQPRTPRPDWSTTSPEGWPRCPPGRRPGIIERSIVHFRAADPEFGERVARV